MEFVLGGGFVVLAIFPFVYPRWRRWEIMREHKRNPRQVSAGGLIAPFDEVFHPTAYTANLLWEAEKTIPAPTPDADNNWPDLRTGRIAISIPQEHKD
ncbi:MAG: hypothetical protein JWQ43_3060 [Glaciihabitans sp.]|nr:hypothetical protein [Glaciihabitans sp.]